MIDPLLLVTYPYREICHRRGLLSGSPGISYDTAQRFLPRRQHRNSECFRRMSQSAARAAKLAIVRPFNGDPDMLEAAKNYHG